jgi:hydrogenase small subunit
VFGNRSCIVKLGCWGPVVNCNVGQRGWVNGVGGCASSGGICIGCTMPAFPDRFQPFLEQPPGSLLSAQAVTLYGLTVKSLRSFTQATLNQEPEERQR